jgi:hypothetical protein
MQIFITLIVPSLISVVSRTIQVLLSSKIFDWEEKML